MKTETFTRVLPVVLTPEELKAMSDNLAESVIKAETEESDQKDAKASMKVRLDGMWSDVHRLSIIVREGKEEREIKCYEQKFYELGLVRTIREDTSEVVSSRVMNDSERNVSLFDANEGRGAQ